MLLLLLTACRVEMGPPAGSIDPASAESDDVPAGEVWVYTSAYQSVLDALDPLIHERFPDVDVKWFQSGSEKVAQRYEAEVSAGGSPACLLMTSDPFWYTGLARRGDLQPYLTPTALQVDRQWVDPDGLWVASRVSLMVMGKNPGATTADPKSFGDLVGVAGTASMPDPLASGTAFTWLAFELDAHPERIPALRSSGLVAAGGNSAVMQRMETGERPIGVVLLENILAGKRKDSPVEPIFPEDGAVAIPGPLALTRHCPNPTAAKAVYDLILSPEGQRIIAGGDMYPVLDVDPPAGAPPLDAIAVKPWRPGFVGEVTDRQAQIKADWAAP